VVWIPPSDRRSNYCLLTCHMPTLKGVNDMYRNGHRNASLGRNANVARAPVSDEPSSNSRAGTDFVMMHDRFSFTRLDLKRESRADRYAETRATRTFEE
jgi:hypothetical protein